MTQQSKSENSHQRTAGYDLVDRELAPVAFVVVVGMVGFLAQED
jgi:hypothetical protein